MLEGSLSPTVLEVSVLRLRLLFVSFSFSSSRFFSSKMKGKSVFKKELEEFSWIPLWFQATQTCKRRFKMQMIREMVAS